MTATLNQIWLTIYGAGDVVEAFHNEATAHASIRPGCEAIREVTWITGPGTRPLQPTAQPKEARMKAQKKRRAGRKLTQGVQRYPGGQIVEAHRKPVETQKQILATVAAQPHRRGFSDPQNPLLGYPMGRLLYAGLMSKEQHEAGEWYAKLRLDFNWKVRGIRMPQVSAHLREYIAASQPLLSHANDDDNCEAIARLQSAWAKVQFTLADHRMVEHAERLLRPLCIEGIDIPISEIGTVREILNIIARIQQKGA